MPVIVHGKVVDITVVAHKPFPLVQFSRPLGFTSCIPLTRWSMPLLRRSSIFSVAGRGGLVEIPQLQPLRLLAPATVQQLQYSDKVVDVLAVQVVVLPQVQFL